jgi:hypothetical protein
MTNTWQRRRQQQQTSKVLPTSTAKTIKQTNKQKDQKQSSKIWKGERGEKKKYTHKNPKVYYPLHFLENTN